MIYIADIASVGSQHEQFNISFTKLVELNNPGMELVYFSDASHSSILAGRLENVTFKDVDIYKNRGGFQEFIRGFCQYRDLSNIVRNADQIGAKTVYVLLLHPFGHLLFKLFTKHHANVRIVIHGELESVRFNKHFVNKIWGYFLTKAFALQKPVVQYIILGQSIFENLVKTVPSFKRQKAFILDHPYPFEEKPLKRPSEGKVVFSSLGVATLAKDSQYLFEVAGRAHQLGFAGNVKFNVCGKVYKNMEPYLNDFVHYKANHESLSRDEFDTLLCESDFAVFYYNNVHYSLCPSGAFWDAINAEIPLLFVKNDYFDYYAKIAGPIGVAFDNPQDLNEYILQLATKNLQSNTDYPIYVANIRRVKYEHMNFANLSAQLKTIA
ncbi:hypothetical protein [Dyadobacter arcticus]|uniref:Uncharacterized protein n=1 Tax=Dyadobacter arcticus TaxID=1078754 RepID=A0ABX0UHR8_9BACT|nr:hypothetical protein [Dyadobacter arcticus]NIJ51564.1 hypothetical protein [Dyadobacter arcticus]